MSTCYGYFRELKFLLVKATTRRSWPGWLSHKSVKSRNSWCLNKKLVVCKLFDVWSASKLWTLLQRIFVQQTQKALLDKHAFTEAQKRVIFKPYIQTAVLGLSLIDCQNQLQLFLLLRLVPFTFVYKHLNLNRAVRWAILEVKPTV